MMLIQICCEEQPLEMVLIDFLLLSTLSQFEAFFSQISFSSQLTGPPDSVPDWTQEFDSEFSNQNANNQAFSRKHWRLLQCQNGRLFSMAFCINYQFTAVVTSNEAY